MHFKNEFGSNSVFTLESASDDQAFERFDIANRHRANALFDDKLNYGRLKKLVKEADVVHVSLSGANVKDDKSSNAAELMEDDLKMFAISKEGKLHVYGSAEAFSPKTGWTVVVLRLRSNQSA